MIEGWQRSTEDAHGSSSSASDGVRAFGTGGVLYNPETQVLIIENGQSSEIAEEMAQDVVVFYDKDDDTTPTSAVAVRIDCAEHVLKPFIDAVLAKRGNYQTQALESVANSDDNHL